MHVLVNVLKGGRSMKKSWLFFIPVFLFSSTMATADASWLSKQLDKLDAWSKSQTAVSTTSDGTMSLPPQSERWIKISENKFYATYGDTRTLKARGQAQDRQVEGYFKRVYTPIGSQWLGNTSNGYVKPDVITHSIYKASYTIYNFTVTARPLYYDVHNNLIYEGSLTDLPSYFSGQRLTPDSEEEQIKDKLFHAFGWDY